MLELFETIDMVQLGLKALFLKREHAFNQNPPARLHPGGLKKLNYSFETSSEYFLQ
jgi:hypothetical protein